MRHKREDLGTPHGPTRVHPRAWKGYPPMSPPFNFPFVLRAGSSLTGVFALFQEPLT
jgi:hypothetical protein